jgi:1-deoxy-D-xylulose-5-phosphate synthase
VLHYLAAANLLHEGARVRAMHLPDRFIAHGSPAEQYRDAGLEAGNIVAEVFKALDRQVKVLGFKAKA